MEGVLPLGSSHASEKNLMKSMPSFTVTLTPRQIIRSRTSIFSTPAPPPALLFINPPSVFCTSERRSRARSSKFKILRYFDTFDGAKPRFLNRGKKRRFLRPAQDTASIEL